MKNNTWIRIVAEYYFLLVALLWLALGIWTLVEGEVQLSGDVEGWSDRLIVVAFWILPFGFWIYLMVVLQRQRRAAAREDESRR